MKPGCRQVRKSETRYVVCIRVDLLRQGMVGYEMTLGRARFRQPRTVVVWLTQQTLSNIIQQQKQQH